MDKVTSVPELMFGLVGPLGTDLSAVAKSLQNSLKRVNYSSEIHRLSDLMRDLPKEPWNKLEDGYRDSTIAAHMAAGNKLRETLGRNDAMAMLGLMSIRQLRSRRAGERTKPLNRFAHILHSLKRPEEVHTLRKIYGPAFVVLAAYAPRPKRVIDLARRIADSRHSNQYQQYLTSAENLIQIDEAELGVPFGQNVEDTFPIADVVINTSGSEAMSASLDRTIELLFGNVLTTPTADEQGMYLARAAALRSASLARQVGAAVCRQDGSLVALGMNEVPKSGGGTYWASDAGDSRDFRIGYDTSDRMRENVFAEILKRLKDSNWLSREKTGMEVKDLVMEALRDGNPPIMKGAQFLGTIDYVRAVHAEMAALTDAARYGVSTHECTLYTTTFPCHDCAKHIVASGLKRVVYIEPYRKSLVQDLYDDSVAVDPDGVVSGKVRFEPFVGVAPRRYSSFFDLSTSRRKDKDGSCLQWKAESANPRLPDYLPLTVARIAAEEIETSHFWEGLREQGLVKEEGNGQ